MPAVNVVGEPCAGEPLARFEAAGAGNGAPRLRPRQWDTRMGNHRHLKAAGPTARTVPPRQLPTLRQEVVPRR